MKHILREKTVSDRELLEIFYGKCYSLRGVGLEIGCGKYPVSRFLHRDAACMLIDIVSHEVMHGNPAVKGSCLHLPFVTGQFDFVVISYLLCSLDNVNAGVSEIHRVLRKGGVLLALEHGPPRSAFWHRYAKCRYAATKRFGKCNAASDPCTPLESAFSSVSEIACSRSIIPWRVIICPKVGDDHWAAG